MGQVATLPAETPRRADRAAHRLLPDLAELARLSTTRFDPVHARAGERRVADFDPHAADQPLAQADLDELVRRPRRVV
jgi:hypothetical protein